MSVLSWLLAVLRRLLHSLNTLTQIGRRALLLLVSFIKRRGIDLPRMIAHFNPDKHTTGSTGSRQEMDTGTCGFQHSAEIVRPSVVPSDPKLLQPPTLDDNYIPPHYHFRSNSESGSEADDVESQDFNPPLMVNAPIVPPVSGALAPLPVPVPLLSEAHPRIFPGSPDTVRRYERYAIVPDEPTRYTIPPLTIALLPNAPPSGWTRCLHPEGAQYFFNEEKRVFTDANLFDNESFMFINSTMHTVHDFLRAYNVQLPPDVDLVLDEYLYTDQSKGCQYYFVNHKDRCVFWMDKAESSELFPVTEELNGITSASHIQHELEAQYWYHCELYPRSLEVTDEIVNVLRDILLHALGDLITSSTSTVAWTVDNLNHMINLTNGLATVENVGKNVDNKFDGSSCLVGRFMYHFVRARVYNFHGEPGARLNVDQSVYGTVRRRTLLITLLSPMLFYAPDFYLFNLYTIYPDGIIRHRDWPEFITRLHNEWRQFTLDAAVVLNANVAFLSIQSIDQGGFALPDRTPGQIASYVSLLTSIGAIIIGLLLLKNNRNRERMTAVDAARFIFSWTHPTLGLETLAVLSSLPYAMLVWSLVSFLAAVSFMCFENADVATRTLVGVSWTAVAALILWCIFSSWESGNWGWLRRLLCRGNTAEDEEQGDMVEESKSATSESRPRKRRWVWPSMSLRGRFYDSTRTAKNLNLNV
ncbi:hypothetical protein FB451DRAFT_1363351 [Mycena latifolia]|nr:hypothetical protein FB451DRAFT_1363351 [Mycena latifolia]